MKANVRRIATTKCNLRYNMSIIFTEIIKVNSLPQLFFFLLLPHSVSGIKIIHL